MTITARARLALAGDGGQTIVIFAILLPVLILMFGVTVDVGNLYVSKRHLQSATDAAALAAAGDLPNGNEALLDACTFGAVSFGASCPSGNAAANGKNYDTSLGNVSASAQLECLSEASAGASCATGAGCMDSKPPTSNVNYPGCNAIKVTQTTNISTFVLGFLGFASTKVTTTSTASMAGGRSSAVNVEVVLDSTGSMSSHDNCGANAPASGVTGIPYTSSTPTAEDCAKAGMRALLETLDPCDPANAGSLTSCGTAVSNNYSKPEDEVGLVTYPPLGGSTASPPPTRPTYVSPGNGLGFAVETNCIKDLVGGAYFLYPSSSTKGNYDPSNNPQYQIVPLSSDYKVSDATSPADDSLLNPNSNLVKAVYWGKCPGGVYPANGGTQSGSLSTPGSSDETTAANGSSTSSITISKPGSAPASGDLFVVAVTVKGTGVAICAPAADTSWTSIGSVSSSTGSNDVTMASFYSTNPSVFTFSFKSGTCSGASTNKWATAVAAHYSGEIPVGSPIDVSATGNGSGKTISAPSVTTGNINDAVISLFGTSDTSLSGVNKSGAGTNGATGIETGVQTSPGDTGTTTATSSSSAPWVAMTIAVTPADGGCSGQCFYGLEDPGGAGTLYSDAIAAAKATLDAAAASRPDVRKVIILLSDGVANLCDGGLLSGSSCNDGSTPCLDAVNNAMTAEQGSPTATRATIYAIAYGNSSGSGNRCVDASGTTLYQADGACAMRLIADNPVTDTTHGLAGGTLAQAKTALCGSGSYSTDSPEHFYKEPSGTDLSSVFRAIGQSLTNPRLVSDGAA
jgi:Flp pilus assembly protein TadG